MCQHLSGTVCAMSATSNECAWSIDNDRGRWQNIETHRRIRSHSHLIFFQKLSHTTGPYANAYASFAWPRYGLHFLLNYCNGIERKKHTFIHCRRLCHLRISFHVNMLSQYGMRIVPIIIIIRRRRGMNTYDVNQYSISIPMYRRSCLGEWVYLLVFFLFLWSIFYLWSEYVFILFHLFASCRFVFFFLLSYKDIYFVSFGLPVRCITNKNSPEVYIRNRIRQLDKKKMWRSFGILVAFVNRLNFERMHYWLCAANWNSGTRPSAIQRRPSSDTFPVHKCMEMECSGRHSPDFWLPKACAVKETVYDSKRRRK